MKPEVKAKFVEALRSGKYIQAYGRMKVDGCYCALGVLCDVADPEGWDGIKHRGCTYTPSGQVHELTGLADGERHKLVGWNDGSYLSFSEIANLIEGSFS